MLFYKNLIFFCALFLISSFSIVCQNTFEVKKISDSLYEKKKYQESYKIYKKIISENKIAPDMVLKMAYINEGLGDYTLALYYLNMYQLNYPSSVVLKKMDDLGAKHQLIGYEFTDYEYFVSVYNKFNSQILIGIVSVSVLIFLFSAYRVFITKKYIRVRLYMALIILLVSYAFINLGIPSYKGIVAKDRTFVMNAPSAGAKVLSAINKGNRINILKKDEVWYEVLWDNNVGFIKHDQLYIIVNSRNAEQFNVFSLTYNFVKKSYFKLIGLFNNFYASTE